MTSVLSADWFIPRHAPLDRIYYKLKGPLAKMEQPKSKIVTLKVAPAKLKAIINKPRPQLLPALNPHAATPATPVGRRTERSRQIIAAAEASATQGNTLFTGATFAVSFGSTPSSPSSFASTGASTSDQQITPALSPFSAAVQEPQPPLFSPGNTVMAEKDNQKPPAAASSAAAPANGEGGVPFYESQRKHLQKLLERKRKLTESLVSSLPLSTQTINDWRIELLIVHRCVY